MIDTVQSPSASPDGVRAVRAANLPTLSAEQRSANLALAARARSERARYLKAIKAREIPWADALCGSEIAAKIPVERFLRACPGIGSAKAAKIMAEVGISPHRRIRGLGRRQRELLMETLSGLGI